MLADAGLPYTSTRFRLIKEVSRKQGSLLLQVFDNDRSDEAALKLIDLRTAADPTIRARYPRELELIRSLSNPGILPVLEYGEEVPGWFYILMPWMRGGSLGAKLRTERSLSLAQADCILQPVTEALDAAHALGIYHLDIHPENILFDNNDRAFLSDFGMLRFAQAWREDASSWIFGPAAYLPPEMAWPDPVVDSRTDVYMLGAVTFEMLAGSRPYPSEADHGSILQHLTAPVPRLVERGPETARAELAGALDWNGLDAVLHCAMAKDPDWRFERAGELLTALLAAEGLVAPAKGSVNTIFTLSGRPRTRTMADGTLSGVGWTAAGPAMAPPPPARPVAQPATRKPGKSPRKRRGGLVFLFVLVFLAAAITGGLYLATGMEPARMNTLFSSIWPSGYATLQAAVYGTPPVSGGEPAGDTPAPPVQPSVTADLAAAVTTAVDDTGALASEPTATHTATKAPPTATLAPTATLGPPTATLPPPTSPTTYTIAYNDTLFTIASQFYVSINELTSVNNLRCSSTLPPATRLIIPPAYSYFPPAPYDAITDRNLQSLTLLHLMDCTTGVKALDVSPDGRILAVASGNYAYLWEVGSWKPLARLKGHRSLVTNVQFSPDSTLLATGSEDRTIRLWNVETGEELVKMSGHTNTITSLVFSPDGQLLVSTSRDQSVRFWQVDGSYLDRLYGYPAFSAAFSPDGETLAVGYTDAIRLYHIQNFTLSLSFPSLGVVHSLAFSPSGMLLAAPSEVWSIPLRQRVYTLNQRGDQVSFSNDGRLLAVGRRFYRVSDGDLLTELKMPLAEAARAGDVFDATVFSPDGSMYFWGAPDGLFVYGFLKYPPLASVDGTPYTVQEGDTLFNIANAHNKTLEGVLSANSLTCSNVIFPSQELVIPPGYGLETVADGGVRPIALDNVTGLQKNRSLNSTCLVTPGTFSFSPDSKYLQSGSGVWDLATGALVLQVTNPPVTTSGAYEDNPYSPLVVFAPSAPQAAVRTGQSVELWDLLTGRRQFLLSGHTDNVTSMAYSPDGTQIASSGNIKDKDIRIWNTADGMLDRMLHGWSAYDLRYTADGQRLIANSIDTMRFWSLEEGRMVDSTNGVGEYVFTPDSHYLAFISCATPGAGPCSSEIITLYDVLAAKTQYAWTPVSNQITWLAVSPDGKYVAATAGNGATVWNVADRSEKVRLGGSNIQAAMDRIYFVPAGAGGEITMVATVTVDNVLWFWNIETGTIVHSLILPSERLAFTPDGRYMFILYRNVISIYRVP